MEASRRCKHRACGRSARGRLVRPGEGWRRPGDQAGLVLGLGELETEGQGRRRSSSRQSSRSTRMSSGRSGGSSSARTASSGSAASRRRRPRAALSRFTSSWTTRPGRTASSARRRPSPAARPAGARSGSEQRRGGSARAHPPHPLSARDRGELRLLTLAERGYPASNRRPITDVRTSQPCEHRVMRLQFNKCVEAGAQTVTQRGRPSSRPARGE